MGPRCFSRSSSHNDLKVKARHEEVKVTGNEVCGSSFVLLSTHVLKV